VISQLPEDEQHLAWTSSAPPPDAAPTHTTAYASTASATHGRNGSKSARQRRPTAEEHEAQASRQDANAPATHACRGHDGQTVGNVETVVVATGIVTIDADPL
jgi:hypothetical protein